MKRIIVVCEGQTEQIFCNAVLSPYFIGKNFHLQAPIIKQTRGGIVKWEVLKKQIETHLLEDSAAYVTTFIDYYGLYQKHNFPGWNTAERIMDKHQRLTHIEAAMKSSLPPSINYRFIPYLQLHEFEGLLFNDISIFHQEIPQAYIRDKQELEDTFAQYDNPEMINNNKETSPSHRLKRIILGYNKVVYGNILAEAIGLQRIRQKSPRFNNWLLSLEAL